jgi:KDO2-lipid IV(A) lauroyltransferase
MVRAIASIASRARWMTARGYRTLLRDEIRRSFPTTTWTDRTLDHVARSAVDLQIQCLCEELLLGRLDAANVGRFVRFDGQEHLDAALARGHGAVLVYPHAGAVMLMIALLSLHEYDYTQVAARGLPPPDKAASPDLAPNRWNLRVRAARERAEDHLPARYHGMDAPPRALYRTLARNGIVGIAFDGRGGSKFRPVQFLGRPALLSTGPWRLAAHTGAAILPAMCVRDRDRSHRVCFFEPAWADPTVPLPARCERLIEHAVRRHVEPALARRPDHYATWLVHARVHAAMDDHPLFVDTAPDDRWRAHQATGW